MCSLYCVFTRLLRLTRTINAVFELRILVRRTQICPKALSDVYSLRQSIVQTTIHLVKAGRSNSSQYVLSEVHCVGIHSCPLSMGMNVTVILGFLELIVLHTWWLHMPIMSVCNLLAIIVYKSIRRGYYAFNLICKAYIHSKYTNFYEVQQSLSFKIWFDG